MNSNNGTHLPRLTLCDYMYYSLNYSLNYIEIYHTHYIASFNLCSPPDELLLISSVL